MSASRRPAASVLVIDDVLEIVEELVELLALLEIPAIGAVSLAEAEMALKQNPEVRVIVCDVRLHRESGLEIFQKIAANSDLAGHGFKFIFMTGDPLRPDAIEARQHCQLVTKPVAPAELVSLVRQLLEGERLDQ